MNVLVDEGDLERGGNEKKMKEKKEKKEKKEERLNLGHEATPTYLLIY